jgi:molybdopterin molybdotransferase
LISYADALAMVLDQARSFGEETMPLEQAFGRILTGPVRADRDYPPFPRATMDGVAMRSTDLESGLRRFIVVETIMAGDPGVRPLGLGECYKIMTGAAVPLSADTVIRREDLKDEEGVIILGDHPWRRYQNIARQGEDLIAGSLVIDRPCLCEASVIGLLATLGRTTVNVARTPGAGLLTTGNEVVSPGADVGPVQIRNTNRWLLEAVLKKFGAGIKDWVHAPDDPALLRRGVERLLEQDMVIVSGGVSAGDADHVPAVLEAAGVRRLFHKIAIRPGKPVWVGVAPEGQMVFALPGNPFSGFVTSLILIRPYLQACFGLPPTEPLGLMLGAARKKRSPLDEFFPALLQGTPARLMPMPINTSGDIRLGMQANMLALHPAGSGDLEPGETVLCYPI